MLKTFPRLKCFIAVSHKNSTICSAFLIHIGKWKVSAGLEIHPKKILRRTNKECKALEKVTQSK